MDTMPHFTDEQIEAAQLYASGTPPADIVWVWASENLHAVEAARTVFDEGQH